MLNALRQGVHGHVWTLAPHLVARARPPMPPPGRSLSFRVPDERFENVRLAGWLSEPGGATTLVVLIHGLGGTADSQYVVKAANVADRKGMATLRLSLRGADGSGEDFYHAGLSADLSAVLCDERLKRFEKIYVIGFSLGGHMVLRFNQGETDPRVSAVAAVCAPLDLAACSRAMDAASRWVYRQYVLFELKAQYLQVAQRRSLPTTALQAKRIWTLGDWDDRIVAPRHGFTSADDYYRETSAGPRLSDLQKPTYIFVAAHDPMIPGFTLRPSLEAAFGPNLDGRRSQGIEVVWHDRGGHVGYPPDLAVDEDVIAWLSQH